MTEIDTPRRGDRYIWQGLAVLITRVAADRTWTDIRVQPGSLAGWGKRQPLPFPDTFEREVAGADLIVEVSRG